VTVVKTNGATGRVCLATEREKRGLRVKRSQRGKAVKDGANRVRLALSLYPIEILGQTLSASKFPPDKKGRKLPNVLTAEEFRRFYQAVDRAANAQHALMLRLLFYTGVVVFHDDFLWPVHR
jgi:integrase